MMLDRLMPLLVIALLVGLPRALPNSVTVDREETDRRMRAVTEAIAEVPYRIGPWAGADEPAAPAAIKLLHANAILSRRYERIGGSGTVSVLVVHCTDVRDMRGHWPPMCYPANGWSARSPARGAPSDLRVDGRVIPAREYEFERGDDVGFQTALRVVNFFIMPGGTVTGELEEISRQSERLARAVLGVAQVQIVTPADMPRDEAAAAAAEIFEAMPELFAALGMETDDGE